ncbi:Na/Pi cotransporter family protein [Kocuria sp. p3-SID1433]|uniref:Na/Pi cotransporter family protein n=1 Tax=unclassified Kocuria TaxID=2649579 RepID=UPI0021A275B2|nr:MULTISPECIES: Na/Pi cotransporter family protein [unclassified Kocuria]MCT1601431.1 Na/Pi cotransporter family protein [Kocuria sp. p3-SID1428]MCT2179271.1 Na/Pi cotransporter family protein [Kocuria sp. p3-SID1433]
MSTQTADELAPETIDQDEAAQLRSPLERFGLSGKALEYGNWIAVAVGIYILITAVNVIGDGFKSATGGQAEELFAFAENPLIALMIGVLATGLIQSSSTTTSIVVGLAAGGLPMEICIPMLMGANIGTTLTSTLVSLGMVRDKESFRRGFAAASVHDMFNLFAVVIFLPLEMLTGILEKSSGWLSEQMAGSDGGIVAVIFGGIGAGVTAVTEPLADLIGMLAEWIPQPWGGILLIFIGIGLILSVINFIGSLLKVVMVGRAKQVLHSAIGRGPITGIFSGMLITIMVQSSSTTTALVVPLAGSGTFSVKQIYPFTLGANIGTTVTALIAAFAFSGVEAQFALQAALVHLLFNLLATALIFGVPFLRVIPLEGAALLGELGARNKLFVVAWVLGVFVVVPAVLIFLTVVL